MFQLFLIFILGLLVGSFLNVAAIRLISGESVAQGRSHCGHCSRPLRARELIPIFSFIFLKGRCASCYCAISLQYPIVEFATALLFSSVYFMRAGFLWPPSFEISAFILRDWFFVSALIVIFLQDLRHFAVLDAVVLPVAAAGFIANFFLTGEWRSYFLAAFIGLAFFGLQYMVSYGRWVGEGDVRLGGLLGLMLGVNNLLLALGLAYLLGAIVSIGLLTSKKFGWKSPMPMGAFLAIGGVIALLWGERIVEVLGISF